MKKEKTINIIHIGLICLILLGLILYMAINSTVIQSDTIWHIKNGEWIIQNKQIPTTDSFSIHNNLNFMAHEWLFDVIMASINSFFGLNGIIMVTILFVLFGYVYALLKSKSYKLGIIILTLFAICGFYKSFMVIPDTFASILLIIIGVNLFEKKSFKRKIILNCIFCILLVNVHGGMMTACLVQAMYILGFEIFLYRKNKVKVKEDFLLFISTIVSGLINPYFIKVYTYSIMMRTEASKYISDWDYFSFHSIWAIGIIVLLTGLFIYGYYKNYEKTRDIPLHMDILVIVFYLIMLLRFNRTINLFSYMFIIISTKYIEIGINKLVNKVKIHYEIGIYILSVVSIFILTSILLNADRSLTSINQYIEKNYISENTLELIKGKTIFNSLEVSGFLIYKDIPVFIDGRIDPYTPEYDNPDIFNEYIKALYSENNMEKLVVQYGIDTLVLNTNSLETEIYRASDKWELIETTNKATIFTRKE